ncbi:CDP-diacylglycerol--glycerol-3-phosphate 3-phosphatidyltransferase, partial [Cronobacter sakazakii]
MVTCTMRFNIPTLLTLFRVIL